MCSRVRISSRSTTPMREPIASEWWSAGWPRSSPDPDRRERAPKPMTMAPGAARTERRSGARAFRDPALTVTVAALWLLLGLFVLYPLVALLATAFLEDGQLSVAPLASVLGKPNTRAAFLNSLWLGTLVGIIGTAL